ncbi:MAG: hypothetical protein Q8S96_01600 [Hydrogenophaga sp.]|uniref:hypothetical protein n=1 Tax=Hydrogenophaga sp. TaxID=1904254 RepID=UPI002735DC0B|nr:hypothetical protein [Hydrogenophaga sp.]MDP3343135.1 hypothetical protein [Hydrogenophaga sp.]MDP3807166.1 hypothetical protein [Hydrogenophaga sp.]
MHLVVLLHQRGAGALVGFELAGGKLRLVWRDRLQQHEQGLGVVQQAFQVMLLGRVDEAACLRVIPRFLLADEFKGLRFGQWLQVQLTECAAGYLAVVDQALQGFAVGAAAPVGLAAGNAEWGCAELLQLGSDEPDGGVPGVALACGVFVQPVNEQRAAVATGWRVQLNEVAGRDAGAAFGLGQCLESLGFARPRVGDQHPGMRAGVGVERCGG